MADHENAKGKPVPAHIRFELARAVDSLGEREVRNAIGVSPATLARALSGLRVYSSTGAVVRTFVAEYRARSAS